MTFICMSCTHISGIGVHCIQSRPSELICTPRTSDCTDTGARKWLTGARKVSISAKDLISVLACAQTLARKM